jgi:hypothetical protein
MRQVKDDNVFKGHLHGVSRLGMCVGMTVGKHTGRSRLRRTTRLMPEMADRLHSEIWLDNTSRFAINRVLPCPESPVPVVN